MSKPPNILIVICDDLGVGDLGSSGNSIARTPELDCFRAGGVDAGRHISGPLCTPARSALFTGLYAQRTRAIDTYCGRALLDPEIPTLAERLQSAGYRTGCFGKWHLGDNCPFRPQDRGFDTVCWHGSGGVGQPGDALQNEGRESYFDPWLFDASEARPHEGFITDVIADAAVEFMHVAQPWFAYVGFNAPHTPLQAPRELIEACRERGATGQLAALYALVEGVDTAFGRMLRHLETTGQRENTIIHFTSDHGPCPSVTDADGAQRYNAGLRGQKGHVYEGGARVPALWQWPARWQPSRIESTNTHVIDVAPTVLEACGVAPQERVDGQSLCPLFQGNDDTFPSDRPLFLQWHRGDRPVRYRNAAVWQGRWKWLRVCESGADELYDLEADPGEQNDLASAHPELCKTLSAQYESWFDEVGAPHDYAPLSIHIGDSREPEVLLSRQDWRVRGADGWSSTEIGYWPVEVLADASYTVSVVFDPADAPPERGTVELFVGDQRLTQEARPGQQEYRFDALSLRQGATCLEARLHSRFTAASPKYLKVLPTS
jgi:arylsulfatase A-like enzyme